MASYGSGVGSLTDRCTECGIEPWTLTPSDAAVAVRSFPRRFRALLVRPDHRDRPHLVAGRAEGGWSALEHTAHVADVMVCVADALRLVQVHDDPAVTVEPAPPRTAAFEELEEVLADLERACEELAHTVDGVSGHEWERRAHLEDGTQVTALDLVRHAVHMGAHHRRLVERIVEPPE